MNNKQLMDGCAAATWVAYTLSEVATIYPITPIAEMGEVAQKWGLAGLKNIFGSPLQVKEMESELGAAGATHGALAAGSLATTFTNSQGLLLMIPNMYKIAGNLLPAVFHVGSRSLATQALSIHGDHQDVMACRATGFAFLASASVQETMDLALVAHLAAIEGSVPVCHFFDGWRTSNELATIDAISFDEMKSLVDFDRIRQFRSRALNPEHPTLRGSCQNSDVYFQNREAANRLYDAFPGVVQKVMDKVGELTGRRYGLADYYGDPQADRVIVTMASSTATVRQAVDMLNASGEKTGMVALRLFRPFPTEALLAAIPPTAHIVATLDRTKEPGSQGEPLFLDVAAAIQSSGRDVKVIGGRYGLSSKDFSPAMAIGVFDEMAKSAPRPRFTVGIDDDVTHLSIDYDRAEAPLGGNVMEAVFYGIGSDGTVGATKQAAKVLASQPDTYVQAYFEYSAKKSGGYTISQLRISDAPISAAYNISSAGYVGCNKDVYVKRFALTEMLRPGGTLVINSSWNIDDMEREFPASLKRGIASKNIRLYNVDAAKIAAATDLGVRINMIMETVFFKLSAVLPIEQAVELLKQNVEKIYMHEGGKVVDDNLKAIDMAVDAAVEVHYPSSWAYATDSPVPEEAGVPEFIRNVARPCLKLEGGKLPVSAFTPDGSMPMGTTAYEKRRIALQIPQWDYEKCVQCTECSLVCPHATIRPYLLDTEEAAGAPEGLTLADAHSRKLAGLKFRIQVYPEDCTGCGSCAVICPGHALTMVPLRPEMDRQIPMLDYIERHVTIKDNLLPHNTINGSQFVRPLMEFSGACAGCGETPYVKLLTQLFGRRMLIANATGCSSVWGANYPSNAYCTDNDGRGPAWGNSLFEDNAEYGYGMAVAIASRREELAARLNELTGDTSVPQNIRDAAAGWLTAKDDATGSETAGRKLTEAINACQNPSAYSFITAQADILGKKTVWAIGGDGWAYDIGFAGLDHVMARNTNINILVMDTECYSNTGGQMSKATPLSCVAKYAANGKRTYKKDLGRMMMCYPNTYVASVCLGANYQQTIDALTEAEAHKGPSIVIAYCPCINHGLRAGMSHACIAQRKAVESGYWQLYRYNPDNVAKGLAPLSVDYPKPTLPLTDFLTTEDRYADLKLVDPQEADHLYALLADRTENLFDLLTDLATLKDL